MMLAPGAWVAPLSMQPQKLRKRSLMSLSMVVIASLIGAEGLGALILEALQYVAKGQGLLVGLAILFCAMVIDRIAQGMYRKKVGAG